MRHFILFILLPVFFISCEEEKTVFVADHYGANQSYLIKENESDKWISFTDEIVGFEYEEGFEYVLKVKAEKVKDVLKYSLVSVEKKVKTDFLIKQKIMKELTTTKWEVVSIKGFNNNTKTSPTFTISEGNIKGFSGCNSFGGTIEIDATGTFNPGQLMGTKMYCEATMNLEKAFNKALSYAAKYTIMENKLTVLSKDDVVLFTAIEQVPDSIFATWEVDHIEGFENTTGSAPFFNVLKGRIKGSNTCNGFDGTFTTDAKNKFKVTAIRATKRYCADKDALGKAFHKALATATKYKIRKGKLLLLNDNNDLMLTAKKKQ